MKTYPIIAARSRSKGLPNKTIRPLAGHRLIAHSIDFAKAPGCDRVICSTGSAEHAEISEGYGAETPVPRSPEAASHSAMEEDSLRDLSAVRTSVDILGADDRFSAARTVCESEGRLCRIDGGDVLLPDLDDRRRSMIRRQDIGTRYKVFGTDVIRFDSERASSDFPGRNVFGIPVHKICELDIDDLDDFRLLEEVIKGDPALLRDDLHL